MDQICENRLSVLVCPLCTCIFLHGEHRYRPLSLTCILELLFIRCHFDTLEMFTRSEFDSVMGGGIVSLVYGLVFVVFIIFFILCVLCVVCTLCTIFIVNK